MGQKVHPNGFRVGVIRDWETHWYANKKNFSDNLVEDHKIREYLKEKLYAAGISKIQIERASNKVTVNIHSAKPGIVIGRGGVGVESTKKDVERLTGRSGVVINIIMKQSIGRTMKAGAKGIKVKVSGRLGGAEIARDESYHDGSIPLQTIRANIDYGFAEAKTTYGRIGVKVWIYKGEVLGKARKGAEPAAEGGRK